MTGFLDVPAVRFFPSRHRFALFRLAAFLRLRSAEPRRDPARLFYVDRDQSSFEQYAVAIWATATTAALFTAALSELWPLWAAVLAGIFLSGAAVQTPLLVAGSTVMPLWERLTGKPVDRIRFHSRLSMLLLAVGASAFVRSAGWPQFVSVHFFVLVTANAAAAVVMRILRDRVSALEGRFEVK